MLDDRERHSYNQKEHNTLRGYDRQGRMTFTVHLTECIEDDETYIYPGKNVRFHNQEEKQGRVACHLTFSLTTPGRRCNLEPTDVVEVRVCPLPPLFWPLLADFFKPDSPYLVPDFALKANAYNS